jgi:hypothetical protein
MWCVIWPTSKREVSSSHGGEYEAQNLLNLWNVGRHSIKKMAVHSRRFWVSTSKLFIKPRNETLLKTYKFVNIAYRHYNTSLSPGIRLDILSCMFQPNWSSSDPICAMQPRHFTCLMQMFYESLNAVIMLIMLKVIKISAHEVKNT